MSYKSKLISSIGLGVLCLAITAKAATSPEEVTLKSDVSGLSQKAPAFQQKITGMYYTATQYAPVNGDLDAWNLARLGYQFTENFNLSYNQILLNDYKTQKNEGFNFRLDDAYLRLKWNEAFKIKAPDLKVGLEQRYYIPTSSSSSQKTMVTGLRNRLLTTVKVTNAFSLGLEESPIVFWYRDAASASGPNELLRNYVVVTPTLTGMKGKLNFYFPIYYQTSLYRKSFGGINNRGADKHQVFLWPEITYALNDNLELGVAAVTGNLISDDFARIELASAFKDVSTALEVTLSL